MAYELLISRTEYEPAPITLDEWKIAVEKASGIRLAIGDSIIKNPKTRGEIRVANFGGGAEVYFSASDEWIRAFRYCRNGTVVFNAPQNPGDSNDLVMFIAQQLAIYLKARVVGEEGETYN
jgi:hypothetical protein